MVTGSSLSEGIGQDGVGIGVWGKGCGNSVNAFHCCQTGAWCKCGQIL